MSKEGPKRREYIYHNACSMKVQFSPFLFSCSSSAGRGSTTTEAEDTEDEDLAVPLEGVGVSQPPAGLRSRNLLPSPPKRVDIEEESRSSSTGELDPSIKSVLITASDDLGPMGTSLQQQTTDQNSTNGKQFFWGQ